MTENKHSSKKHVLPSSRETSSISEVTDIRCAVRSGDFSGAAPSTVGMPIFCSVSCSAPSDMAGEEDSGFDSLAAEEVDVGRFVKDRERDRSDMDVGRGVMSGASSKVSYAFEWSVYDSTVRTASKSRKWRQLTPSLSELSPLPGRLSIAGDGGARWDSTMVAAATGKRGI